MTVNTEIKVADIMTKSVSTVGKDDSLYSAICKMETESMSAFPVVDSSGKVCGILSSSDLVKIAYDLQCDVSLLSVASDCVRKTITNALAEDNCDTQVSSAMTGSVETISLNATITEAAQSLINNDIHHLPVVDHRGVPIGIISTLDIVRSVAFPI